MTKQAHRRICSNCKQPFTPRVPRQRFCTAACQAHKLGRARPKTTARGYGIQHQQLRKHWRAHVDSGIAVCTRCGLPIHPGTPWDLDHTDDRTSYLGAAHAGCNRGAANRRRNGTQPAATSRPW